MADSAGTSDAAETMHLGHQIARARAARGLSQQQLADRMGMSKGQLQVIELGLSDRAKGTPLNPQLSTLLQLCEALGAHIDLAYPDSVVLVLDGE